jgi:hypothetical protein
MKNTSGVNFQGYESLDITTGLIYGYYPLYIFSELLVETMIREQGVFYYAISLYVPIFAHLTQEAIAAPFACTVGSAGATTNSYKADKGYGLDLNDLTYFYYEMIKLIISS